MLLPEFLRSSRKARLGEARDLLASDGASWELVASAAGASDVRDLCTDYLKTLAAERDARSRVE